MRMPARAIDSETALLGTMVLMGATSHRFNVAPDMFFDMANRTICQAINQMMMEGVPVDAVTLGEHLAARGELDYCGGAHRICATLDGTPGTHNVEWYANNVRDAYARRDLQQTVGSMQQFIEAGTFDYEEAMAMVRKAGRSRPTKGRSALPVADLIEQFPDMRPVIIDGLLRRGETMNLVAGTKVGKSWLAIGLALSIATGAKWLGKFPTTKGKILHIDTELHPETLSNRIREVAEAMGVQMDELGDYLAIPVRGQGWSVNDLSDEIQEHKPDIVLLDALYRAVPRGQDENSNREMAALYNAIDEAADHHQAGVILIHHSTKGSQDGKATTDIGSGAGAMSRAVDTHAAIVQKDKDTPDEMVFKASLRSFPPFEPIAMVRNHPLWVPLGEVPSASHGETAARRFLGESPAKTDATVEDQFEVITRVLRKHGKCGKKDIAGHWIESSSGLPLPTGGSLGRLLKHAVKQGVIKAGGKAPKSWYELPGDVTEF